MSNLNNERVIFSDKEKKNGYSIQIQSLKRLDEGLKGASIKIKLIQNGEIRVGNLFYQWFNDEKQAEDLFYLIERTIKENVEQFKTDRWLFNYHPIRYLIKHRN